MSAINSEDTKAAPGASPAQRLRGGDTGVGIPLSEGIEGARRLTDEEVASAAEREEELQRTHVERQLEQLTTVGGGLQLPATVVRITTVSGILLAGVLGLLVATQLASLIADLRTIPTPWTWALGGFAALSAGAITWIAISLVVRLVRLRRSPGVNVAAVQALQERNAWQRLAVEHANEAEAELRDYLNSYSLNSHNRKALTGAGLTEAEFDDLVAAKRRLLDDESFLPPAEWLNDFVRRFQSRLDEAADRRAKLYGKRVALGTAISPFAVVDQGIVFYTSLQLVRNLLVLYNVRPAFGQTATILARAVVQTYLAGEIERLAEDGVDALVKELPGTSGELFGSALGTAASTASRLGEGAVNGLLIWRLATRAKSLLQPVKAPA